MGEQEIRVGLIGAGGNVRNRHIPGFHKVEGLEIIGAELSRLYHRGGPKVPCGTGMNRAGEKRNKKHAGITHIIVMTAPEILRDRTVIELEDIRHQIALGLRPVNDLRRDTITLLKDLQVSLSNPYFPVRIKV